MRIFRILVLFALIATPGSSWATHDVQEQYEKMSVEEFCSNLNPKKTLDKIDRSLDAYGKLVYLIITHTASKQSMPYRDEDEITVQFTGKEYNGTGPNNLESIEIGLPNWMTGVRLDFDCYELKYAMLNHQLALARQDPPPRVDALVEEIEQRKADIRKNYMCEFCWSD